MKLLNRLLLGALLFLTSIATDQAEGAVWIWRGQSDRPSPAGERGYLRRTFHIGSKVEKATLEAACAGEMHVYINGEKVGTSPEVKQPLKLDVTKQLKGWAENTIAVYGRATADGMGVVAHLHVELEYGKRQVLETDADWLFSLDGPNGWSGAGFDASKWEKVAVLGKLGDAPFGNVFSPSGSGATPASEIAVPPGFAIELVRSAGPREGSWVCMTVDDKGRLYISPQEAIPESGFAKESAWGGIWRATLDADGKISAWDKVLVPIGGCMGMLWTKDALFLSGQGPEGQAIYKCTSSKGDGNIDAWTLFKKVPSGGGEHGAHGIVLGPDGYLYIIVGNATPLVEGISAESPIKKYAEDDLLPRIKDPVATFFDGVKSPYGHVLRTDLEGKEWQLWCIGMRNAYDLDFSEKGELFTYDSDMEWDVGLPWYRPTRILELMAGGEYGFREGSAKMPDYYIDTLGSVVDVGLGSPTGVKFGSRSHFPDTYRRAFFAMDWTYGRILAIHRGDGPARVEDFVKGKGLPVTDLEFGSDGAMYFTVGGRGTQGGLYRVRAVNPQKLADPSGEKYAPRTVNLEDSAAKTWDASPVNVQVLRALSLRLMREQADEETKVKIRTELMASYPMASDRPDAFVLNRELSQLLVYLQHPDVVEPTLRLLAEARARWENAGRPLPDPMKLGPQEEQIWHARVLCEVQPNHFTPVQREACFDWFSTTARELKGANNFVKYIEAIRQRALERLDEPERLRLEKRHGDLIVQNARPSQLPEAPARKFVKIWTMADLEPVLGKAKAGRNFARGEEIYTSMLCAKCHRMNQDGGGVGPDLTAVGGRFAAKDILEAIIDPSKTISDQYAALVIDTREESHMGLLAAETETELTIYADPFGETKKTIAKSDIVKRAPAVVSLMPAGLAYSLNEEEILDLLAYLQSGGDGKAAAFLPSP